MYKAPYNLDSMTWAEGTDVFNSSMFKSLRKMEKSEFKVRKDLTRLDLICNEIYGNSSNQLMSLLILLNGKTEFKADEIIYYVDTNQLNFVK